MAKKYIKQIDNQNFVFPNKDLAEYDVEIIHDLNENSVSGTITNFTGTSITTTGLTFTYTYTKNINGAEYFLRDSSTGSTSFYSVHVMVPNKIYYKPWQVVQFLTSSNTGSTVTGSTSVTIRPADFGLASFSNGTYYFEFRFIGKRAVYPVAITYTVTTLATPTPTPSPTVTSTPSPTPTITSTPTPTPGGPTFTPTPCTTVTYYELSECSPGTGYAYTTILPNLGVGQRYVLPYPTETYYTYTGASLVQCNVPPAYNGSIQKTTLTGCP